MELVDEIKRDYRVQSESARAFRVTIPKKFSEIADITKGDKLGVRIGIGENYGYINLCQNPSSDMIVREVAGPNHLVRIPASVGSSMQIRREMINWSLHKKGDDYVFRVNTPYIPLIISDSRWENIGSAKLNMKYSDDAERYYIDLTPEMQQHIGWVDGDEVGFLIAQNNSDIAIRCQPNSDQNQELTTVKVNKMSSHGLLRMHIPRALVKATRAQDWDMEILEKNNALALVPSN